MRAIQTQVLSQQVNTLLLSHFYLAFCPNYLGPADAPSKTDTNTTVVNTITVPLAYEFNTDANVTSIKAYISRPSGSVTFGVYKADGLPTICNFVVKALWTTPDLTDVGWQEVGFKLNYMCIL